MKPVSCSLDASGPADDAEHQPTRRIAAGAKRRNDRFSFSPLVASASVGSVSQRMTILAATSDSLGALSATNGF
jgi:hypothetical protein